MKTHLVLSVLLAAAVASAITEPVTPVKTSSPVGMPDKWKPLAEFLVGTKWRMYNRQDRVLEFRKGGKFDLPDWTRQGLAAKWQATGANQVTVTITSAKLKGLTAVFDFDDERTSFTGHDLDKTRKVTKSPRVCGQ